MNIIILILASAMPLVIATIAALVSEYAGRMIFFLDGLITLSAFICYSITVKTQNVFLGIFICILCPLIFVFFISFIIEKFKFNYFIVSLSQNIFLLSCVSVLSSLFFNTRGILVNDFFSFNQNYFKVVSICIGLIIIVSALIFLKKTKHGTYLKITGSDSDVLKSCGINPDFYKVISWMIASVLASFCSVILLFRLSSFVPGISSGIGWTSLAIVFLGKRKIGRSILMAFVFSVLQFISSNLQSFEIFKNIPSGVLLSLPYLICVLLILCVPKKS